MPYSYCGKSNMASQQTRPSTTEMHPKEKLGLDLLKLRATRSGYTKPPCTDPPRLSKAEEKKMKSLFKKYLGMRGKESRWNRRKQENLGKVGKNLQYSYDHKRNRQAQGGRPCITAMHHKEMIGLEMLKLRARNSGYIRPQCSDAPRLSTEKENRIKSLIKEHLGIEGKETRWSRQKEEEFQQKQKLEALYRHYGCMACSVDMMSDRPIGKTRRSDTYGRFLVDCSVNPKTGSASLANLRDLA